MSILVRIITLLFSSIISKLDKDTTIKCKLCTGETWLKSTRICRSIWQGKPQTIFVYWSTFSAPFKFCALCLTQIILSTPVIKDAAGSDLTDEVRPWLDSCCANCDKSFSSTAVAIFDNTLLTVAIVRGNNHK